ncbi:tRNA (adenosine(37)-N6)-threonylcarbamoyltransferase complex ATPase subunit type 1 TsaE [uncultured Campylobacter sp.]|uniref:tRNA (adenosine(37)-N6)-threonylcarbamoyltransferase complex ATPase subunit type 1 TsaE n=1 Tax=uncultured Campylobacter sp. TaxID=218934 RepID=UPI00262B4E7A|nr:tRNA (adenosine(37)-N6)-threonylcarbamoyltransferase complex ATPase subunit type 1 TsaE [uncultured Campylobacter sp.]
MSRSFELGVDELDILVDSLPKEGLLILQGTLASGKTTLAKKIALKNGIKQELTSPTFSIMQSYKNNDFTLFHYDLYQNDFEAIVKNGLYENFFEDGLHIVEWGDERVIEFAKKYELPTLIVKIKSKQNKREYLVYEP